MARQLFREQAIRKISSPEQLDQLVRVTTPRRWIGLVALLVVIAGAIVWATTASVPTKLSTPGYTRPQGGLRVVQAPAAGRVERFDLQLGQHVIDNAPLGTVRAGQGTAVTVRAPVTGTVTELDTNPGGYVSAGARMAVVEPVGVPMVVYTFLPPDVASGIKVGLPVHVVFGAGVGAKYGFARGHVQSVSKYPATASYVSGVLASEVPAAIKQAGSANVVTVSLDLSAHTPSGITWGSGDGPPVPIPPGLPATAEFILGSHHPIDDVF